MDINNKKQISGTLAIFLIIAFIYAVCNFIWWTINTPIIPMSDSAIHFIDIFRMEHLFINAPLLTWLMRVMFYIFGKEHYDLIVIIVNYVFFLIPLYFIYKIGTELKDKETGNIAMILFALVPAVYGMSRQYGHQDYHIIAGITFNIYCLIKTDYFRNRKWTIWYGISVGLGLMIKDAFLAYFFVPFMYIVIMGLKEKADRAKVINIFISIILGSLIAGWHYFRPFIIHKILHDPIIETVPVFAFDSLRITTIGLWEDLLSPPIFIIFVIGLIYFIWKYRGKYKNIILLWFFVPWLIIMLMLHRKVPEYGAGFIPAMILIGAVFISCIDKSYIKKTLILFLIVIGLLQYVDFSYKNLNIALFKLRSKYRYNNYSVKYYNKYNQLIMFDYKQSQLIFKLAKYLKNKYPNEKFFMVDNVFFDKYAFESQIYYNEMLYGKDDNTIWIFVGDINIKDGRFSKKLKEIGLTADEIFKIEQKYYVIDELYFYQTQDLNIKITLFGRKDKFSRFLK